MKKILSFVLALCAITAFACQYPGVIEMEYGYMRHLYIAGVNSVNNHIEAITESSETWNGAAKAEENPFQVLEQPIILILRAGIILRWICR